MKVHLVGGGIASLSAAVYFIKEGGVLGGNIHIYEADGKLGGALDAAGDAEKGYSMRGGRMFEEHSVCVHELFSLIPSACDPTKSIDEELREFYASHSWYNKARLIGAGGRIIDAGKFGLSRRNLLELTELVLTPEALLEGKTIGDCFDLSILDTNFWYMFGSIFAFLPYHSAIEMRRYMLRFFHLLPTMATMTTIQRTRSNQHETVVVPIVDWLKRMEVNFHTHSLVTNIDFLPAEKHITANRFYVTEDGYKHEIPIAPSDFVLVTLGSHVAGSTRGSMSEPPPSVPQQDWNWQLWETLARGRKGFGRPSAFNSDMSKSGWVTFTITSRGPVFAELMEKLTGSEPGRGGLITLKDSNWLLTFNNFHNPHFANQPPDVTLWWGYGLYLDKPGNYIAKKMPECTGAEILEEVIGHLGCTDKLEAIRAESNCIPCHLPYAGSVLLLRHKGDRPDVVPHGSVNLAFIGQFVEIPDEVVFTTEYAVRTARVAVSLLLRNDRPPPPVYKGQFDPLIVLAAAKALYA